MKRSNRIKSRLLSAFLVLVMLVTMVPSWAFADPVTKPQEKQMQSEATSLEGWKQRRNQTGGNYADLKGTECRKCI